jgi:putative addiction module component (TIGR02574 family)
VANIPLLRYYYPTEGKPMPETTIPAPPGFSQLSKAEQVRYLQALWDQIAENPAALPVPESHLNLVEQRLKRYRDDPSPTHAAVEVLDRLSNKST